MKKLKKTLQSVDESANVVGEADSIQGTVSWLQSNPTPDLILMDIELADGQSFEIFNQVQVKSPVIFITSYDEYLARDLKVADATAISLCRDNSLPLVVFDLMADSHIRLANSRLPGSERNLILRRPFNYSRGVTKAGQLDMGLLFICYQASLEAGFVTVQKRLDGEPLEEYIKPVGGGYFFTLPGVPSPTGYLGQPLLERVT